MKTFDHPVNLVHPGPVTALLLTPDGDTLVVATRKVANRKQVGLLKLWSVATAKELATLDGVKKWAWSLCPRILGF